MLEPAIPHDEMQRLAVLGALRVLDTPPAEQLERITGLAARVFDVPIALVSLVDRDRQWFWAHYGLETRQTPRSVSFCGHVVYERNPLIVSDARLDPRFADNPLVTGAPGIVFYAGYPLRSLQGQVLGALCLIDHNPRTLTAVQRGELQDFARLVEEFMHDLERREQLRNTESDLQLSEALFEQTFRHASVGMAHVALDGRWLRVNPALCRMTGYSEAQLLAGNFQSITHPEDLPTDQDHVAALLAGNLNTYALEKRYLRDTGVPFWVMLSVTLLRNADGSPRHFISVVTDIDERKQAELALRQLQQQLELKVEERTRELAVAVDQLNREIDQRIAAQARVSAEKDRFQSTLENTHDAFIELDEMGHITAWNHAANELFGWQANEAIGQSLRVLLAPAQMGDGEDVRDVLLDAALLHQTRRTEAWARHRDGRLFPVEVTVADHRLEGCRYCIAFLHDISERQRDEARIRDSESRLRAITNNMPALISQIGHDERHVFANRAYADWFGLDETRLRDMTLRDVLGSEIYAIAEPLILKVLQGERTEFDAQLQTRQGVLDVHLILLPMASGEGFYLLALDISELKHLQQRLEYDVTHDALTGLPNRRAFLTALEQATGRATQGRRGMALLFLDLNGFKLINDSYGHEFGDKVLQRFASEISKVVRPTDTVARLAGDEFTIILDELQNPLADAEEGCRRLLDALAQVHQIDGTPVTLGASIGVALCLAGEAIPAAALLARADAAMYRAKSSDCGGYAIN